MQPLRRINRGQTAGQFTLPAPVGGWNARDPLDDMPPEDAVALDNFIPRQRYAEVRGGQQVVARNFPDGSVQTGIEYSNAGTRQLIAAGGGTVAKVDDTTNPFTVTILGTGFTSDRWQGPQYGANLAMFNGHDTPQLYDGTTLAASTINGSGLTATNLVGATVHQGRMIAWENAATWFWYGPPGAVQGTFVKFPLANVGQHGGNVSLIESWVRDSGGVGITSALVIMMTSGEVFLYEGTDPGDATAWTLKGRPMIAAPIPGPRGIVKGGGDLLVTSVAGVLSINTVLPIDKERRAATVSDKIYQAWFDAAQTYGATVGWEAVLAAKYGLFVFNVPLAAPAYPAPAQAMQFVVNNDTLAWCRFLNIPARTIFVFKDRLFYGGAEEGALWDVAVWDVSPWASGLIIEIMVGTADLVVDTNGNLISAPIAWTAQTAFTDAQHRKGQKRFTMARPVMQTDGSLPVQIGMAMDYATGDAVTFPVSETATGSSATWDVSPWDTTAWASSVTTVQDWQGVAGFGYSASLVLRGQTQGQTVRLLSTDLAYEMGGMM